MIRELPGLPHFRNIYSMFPSEWSAGAHDNPVQICSRIRSVAGSRDPWLVPCDAPRRRDLCSHLRGGSEFRGGRTVVMLKVSLAVVGPLLTYMRDSE